MSVTERGSLRLLTGRPSTEVDFAFVIEPGEYVIVKVD